MFKCPVKLFKSPPFFPRWAFFVLSAGIDPFYWKDDNGAILGSIQRVKDYIDHHHKTLVFAMNGGMFKPDHSPQGLFIQQGRMITPLDTLSGNGNFYLKPNGVFYITRKKQARICSTPEFSDDGQVWFATQSGPMLLENGVSIRLLNKGRSI